MDETPGPPGSPNFERSIHRTPEDRGTGRSPGRGTVPSRGDEESLASEEEPGRGGDTRVEGHVREPMGPQVLKMVDPTESL